MTQVSWLSDKAPDRYVVQSVQDIQVQAIGMLFISSTFFFRSLLDIVLKFYRSIAD